MDTNTVVPTGPSTTTVLFDYFLDTEEVGFEGSFLNKYIEESLKSSDQVQREDEMLCRIVQEGLDSGAYTAGRYAPQIEKGMYNFHQ